MSTINRTAHGLTGGERIVLSDLVGGSPLLEEYVYYVLAAGLTADTFQIAETDGGTALTFATITSANMQVVPDGEESPDAVYVDITDPANVMAPPTPVPTPSLPTLSTAEVSGIVRLRIVLNDTAEAKVRAWEVNITHKFIDADPDWDTPLVLTIPENGTEASIPALGDTIYAVRLRAQDVYGNFSSYCADQTIQTVEGNDSLSASIALLANDVQDGIITETKIAPGSITTPLLAAGAVTADILAATIVLSSLIKTADTGSRIEIDIAGIRLYDASDILLVNLPTNGDPVYIAGQITTNSLISQVAASFRTAVSVDGNTTMTLQNGVSAPSNPPTVTASQDVLTLTSTPAGMVGAYGIAYDSAAGSFWLAADPSDGGYVAHEYNATTGALIRSIAATGSSETLTATAGATSHVSDFSRAYVGTTSSHIASPITMPSDRGTMTITKVSVYLAGYLGSAQVRNGVWDDVSGTGNLARESSTYTASSGGDVGNGNSDKYDKTLSSGLAVSAGATIYAGYRRINGSPEGVQHDVDQGSSKDTYIGDGSGGDGTSWGHDFSSEKINVYVTYTYVVDTRLETAPNIGIATDGTYIYTLDNTGQVWKYLRSDGSYVANSAVQTAITGSKLGAGMFYDATAGELIITTFTGTGAGVYPKFVRVNTSTLAVSSTVYSAAAGTTFNGTSDNIRGGARLNDPLNSDAATYWVATTSAVYAYTFSGTTATQTSNRDFGQLLTVGDGLTHDGTIFRGYSAATPTKVWKFTGWDWTTASAVYWFCYAWYDSAGTTHETAVGPRVSLTLRRRERVQVINSAIPTGGADDPDKVRIYIKPNATDPGAGNFKLQATDALTARYLTTYDSAGGADGAGTAFPAGTPATLKDAGGKWQLKGDGTVTFDTSVTPGGKPPVVQVYTTSGSPHTWTKPAGISYIVVECVGGGGAGGGAGQPTSSVQSAGGGGGGGGGYARKVFTAAQLTQASYTATTGAGGTQGTAGANAGNAGGNSTFAGTGITTVQGSGGSGGNGGAPSGGVQHVAGGGGGGASGGDINIIGDDGENNDIVADGNGSSAHTGGGGASGAGMGGYTQGRTSSGTGVTGSQYGGGGSGGLNANSQSTNRQGGAGAAGVVIVTEYYGS